MGPSQKAGREYGDSTTLFFLGHDDDDQNLLFLVNKQIKKPTQHDMINHPLYFICKIFLTKKDIIKQKLKCSYALKSGLWTFMGELSSKGNLQWWLVTVIC